MNYSSMTRRVFRGIASSALAIIVLSLPTVATSATDPTAGIPPSYRDFQEFPMCDSTVTTFCVVSWGLDRDDSGTFTTPDVGMGVTFNAWIFSIAEFNSPGLGYELRVDGQQELSPTVPFGTRFQFAINTGAFKPSPSLFTQAEVESFDIVEVDGAWVTSGIMRTSSWPFALGCEADSNCSKPTNQRDYQSFAQGVQFYEEPNLLRDAKRGMWVSTNAAVTGEIQFDRQTMTWTVDLAGPARKADGSINTLRYSTFIPDAFIQSAYGTTADVLARSLAATRTDASVTRAVSATITRVTAPQSGLLISMPSISLTGSAVSTQQFASASKRFSTAPKIRIKPKSALLRAPGGVRVRRADAKSVRVSSSRVSGATRYQAMCTKGATSVFATARTPNIRVRGVTKGTWRCSIRGIKKIGGKWSTSLRIRQ